jgi:transcription initiation factor TFIIIB Brf1 subunit/transcription initiation factor TFIIB
MQGSSPIGLAGACIYISALRNGYHITQKKIAKIAGLCEVTIRNTFKRIMSGENYGNTPQQHIPYKRISVRSTV